MDEFMKVKDKSNGNVSMYMTKPFALTINSFTYKGAGYIKGWELATPSFGTITGKDIDSLIYSLKYVSKDLKTYSQNKKEIILIYTNNIAKAYGFLQSLVEEKFDVNGSIFYFQLLEHIEIRPISIWKSELETVDEIQTYANFLFETVFIPDKYFYITINQRTRKALRKDKKACEDNTANNLYPKNYYDFSYLRKALFGGICYCAKPGIVINKPMLALDITSSYIYSLLIEKHVTDKKTKVKDHVKLYAIHYKTKNPMIRWILDFNGNNLEIGDQYVKVVMTDIDFELMKQVAEIVDYKILETTTYSMDYLPQYARDRIVHEYLQKQLLKGEARAIQKQIVNGIYGDSIRKIEDVKSYKEARKDPYLAPHWGIYTAAYSRRQLLDLALKVEGWYYGDTDSIYCLDTPENRKLIEEFNNKVRAKVKQFCNNFGYDYELMKDLGTFKLEYEIKKFRALAQKEYLFTTIDDQIIVKASGCNKKEMPLNNKLYIKRHLPIGTIIRSFIKEEHSEIELNGVRYYNYGSYYEVPLSGEQNLYYECMDTIRQGL